MRKKNVKYEILIKTILAIIFFIKTKQIFCQKCKNVDLLENSECFSNILYINNSLYRAGQFATNKEGDLFIEYSTVNKRLFYGLMKNGKYYYDNELHYKESNITGYFYDNFPYIGRYESKNLFISTKNDINKTKEYLLSLSSYKTLIEIYDIKNDLIFTNITEKVFNYGIFSYHFSLFGATINNQNTYICIYTHDEFYDINTKYKNGYYFSIKKFSFYEDNNGQIIIELIKSSEKYSIRNTRIISGFLGEGDFIYVIFLAGDNEIFIQKYDYIDLENQDNLYIADDIININSGDTFKTGVFKSLYLKNNLASLIYFKSYSDLRFLILNLSPPLSLFNRKIWNISNINAFPQTQSLNDFVKINNERLVFMTSYYDKINFIFIDLYNNYQNIKIRFYSFTSSAYYFDKELSGYNYNDFFIFTITTVDKQLGYENFTSLLMIFGYVNGTDDEIDIKSYLSDTDLYDINDNIISNLLTNIYIDNNIFGYEIVNEIKLVAIPKEIKIFNISQPDKELKNGDILDKNHILTQNLGIIKNNIFYNLEYQYIIKEPGYSTFYSNAHQTYGDIDDLSMYFKSKIFYGRTNTLKFKLCHKYCDTCKLYGTSDDDQKCLSCLPDYQYDYYNLSNNNCVPEGYFYNITINKLIKCDNETFKFIKDEKTNKKFCIPSQQITHLIVENCSYIGFINKLCKYNYTNSEILNFLIPNLINTYPESNGKSLIIKGENSITFHLTTEENEKNSINDYTINIERLSVLDLKECEDILKKENDINPNNSLIIFKVEKISNNFQDKSVQYEIYHPINKKKLDLSVCNSIDLNMPITLEEERIELYNDLQKLGYDLFNINDPFYQDICSNYKSKDGTDVLLSDRQNDIYDNDLTCQNNCEYSSYSEKTKYLKCQCKIDTKNITLDKFKEIMYEGFTSILKNTNYKFLKCYKLVLSIDSITINYGSIILIILFLIHFCIFIIYIIKGIKPIKIEIVKIIDDIRNKKKSSTIKSNLKINRKSIKIKNRKINFKNNPPKSSPKRGPTFINLILKKKTTNRYKAAYINNNLINIKKDNKMNRKNSNVTSMASSNKSITNTKTMVKTNTKLSQLKTEPVLKSPLDDFNILDDYDLNHLIYEEAIKLDKRTFIQIYCSMLRKKHLVMFAFCTPNDYNLSYIKFSKFVFLIGTNLSMSVLFFFDESMHKIYINSGGFNLIQQIPQIIYSSLVSAFIEFVISFLILSESEFHEIKNNKNIKKEGYLIYIYELLQCIKIKFILYFIFSFVFLLFYWYFVATFCIVYRNTQIIFIKDSFISFGLNLVYPFLKFILFTLCRVISLKCGKNSTFCNFLYKLGTF